MGGGGGEAGRQPLYERTALGAALPDRWQKAKAGKTAKGRVVEHELLIQTRRQRGVRLVRSSSLREKNASFGIYSSHLVDPERIRTSRPTSIQENKCTSNKRH